MKETTAKTLVKLRLSGLAQSLDVRIEEARSHKLDHEEFLELVLQDEVLVRKDRLVARRLKAAAFRDLKPLEDFDWSFNPKIKKKQIFDLAAGRYLEEGRDVLFVGPPGVGKTCLCQALGYAAIKSGHTVLYRSIFDLVRELREEEVMPDVDGKMKKYLSADLVIIDDMGMKALPMKSGEYLFEIVMRRHGVRSTMMTSNRPLEEWGKLLGDVPAATAILDRFLQSADIIEITGKSYRLKDRGKKNAS